jgi:hypothetical protein
VINLHRRLTLLKGGLSALQIIARLFDVFAGRLLCQGIGRNLFHFRTRLIEAVAVHGSRCTSCNKR